MESCVVNFVYLYKDYYGKEEKISFPIDIPYKEDYNELIHRIVALEMDPIMKYVDADKGLKITSIVLFLILSINLSQN